VQAELETLLALQSDDAAIAELEQRRDALDRRIADLDRQRQVASDALSRARGAVDAEERRQVDLQGKITAHKQIHERNLARFDAVRKLRDANAAMAQAELTRKVLADEESELQGIGRRLHDLRQAVEAQESALADVDGEQTEDRTRLAQERDALDQSLHEAQAKRAATASGVPRQLLSRYDKIRSRRGADAVYALRGPSCGNCDTAIPLQRRHMMQASGSIEVCEACGVLLYATN
jgi:predicted  nucleic acid-binding Zn-ribbon protein